MMMSDNSQNSAMRYKLVLFLWFFSCLLCGAYFFGAMARSGVAFEALVYLPKTLVVVWKGVSELLLVFAVWIIVRSKTASKLAISVTVIFIADIALALGAVPLAGLLFALAHLLATFVYSNSRPLSPKKPYVKWLSLVPLILVLTLTLWTLTRDNFQVIAFFPIFSALAAFTALRSSYPFAMNGLGTIVFWLSDFIFVLAVIVQGDATPVGWLVWLTFSSGLLLIVLGVLTNERKKYDVVN